MEPWSPISASELTALIERQLDDSSHAQRLWFEARRIPLKTAAICRNESTEAVFVVAQEGSSVLYYDDVEEGFNFSTVNAAFEIAEPRYEQWELNIAILHWSNPAVRL